MSFSCIDEGSLVWVSTLRRTRRRSGLGLGIYPR